MNRLGVCVVLAVGAHTALLSLPVRSSLPQVTVADVATMQVRVLPQESRGPLVPEQEPQGVDVDESMSAAQPVRPALDEPTRQTSRPVVHEAVVYAEPPPPADSSLFIPGFDPDEGFIPRSMLTEAPRPTGPVAVEFPEFRGEQTRYVSELLLFIDEFGQVLRVRVDGPALPPELEEAARSAFRAARFEAGQIEGRAVRSRIRVEVSFDSDVAQH